MGQDDQFLTYFAFLKKLYIMSKPVSALGHNISWQMQPLGHTIKQTVLFQTADQEICSIWIFYKKFTTNFPLHFEKEFSIKIFVIFYYLTKFYCLNAFTSSDIGQYVNFNQVCDIVTVCDIINFEINFSFFIVVFLHDQKVGSKFKRCTLRSETNFGH